MFRPLLAAAPWSRRLKCDQAPSWHFIHVIKALSRHFIQNDSVVLETYEKKNTPCTVVEWAELQPFCIKCRLGALITCIKWWNIQSHFLVTSFCSHGSSRYGRFGKCIEIRQNKSSWFVAAMTFVLLSMKSEIDESVLCIISDVFNLLLWKFVPRQVNAGLQCE